MAILDKKSKARLKELVEKYSKITERIIVTKDGTIIIKKNMFSIFIGERKDFLNVIQDTLNGIGEEKKDLTYPLSLCSKAISTLVLTNDREKVIKLLYVAHLIDEDPSAEEIDKSEEYVEIQLPKERSARILKYSAGQGFSDALAKLVNSGAHIIFE